MKTFNALSEEVTQQQLNDVEKFADRILAKFNVDIEFTRHFADRMNDPRNKPAVSVAELQQIFKKIAKKKAKDIRQNPDSEAVIKDIQKDLNLPVVISYNKNKEEFEVTTKTIMRKKDFKTSSKVITTEAKKMKDDPCWKDHEMVGTKTKNGKTVPNCVPKEDKGTDMPSESTAEYGKSQAAIARKRQLAAMRPGEMDKLKRLRDMLKNANKKVGVVKKESVDEAVQDWTVTVTKPVNKLKKGAAQKVKARSAFEAINKAMKLWGDPALKAAPMNSFSVTKESVELDEFGGRGMSASDKDNLRRRIKDNKKPVQKSKRESVDHTDELLASVQEMDTERGSPGRDMTDNMTKAELIRHRKKVAQDHKDAEEGLKSIPDELKRQWRLPPYDKGKYGKINKDNKKPVSQMTPKEKAEHDKKRKEYNAYQKSKRESVDEGMNLKQLKQKFKSDIVKYKKDGYFKNKKADQAFMDYAMDNNKIKTDDPDEFEDWMDRDVLEYTISQFKDIIETQKLSPEEMEKRIAKAIAIMKKYPDNKNKSANVLRRMAIYTVLRKKMNESVELDEAMGKLNAKGEIEMTAKNFAKVHKDYKTVIKGTSYAMQLDPKTGGSALYPVKFVNESVELDEATASTKQKKSLASLMTKALGGKKSKPGYTSSIASNGDFVAYDDSMRIQGRIKKGDFTDPMTEARQMKDPKKDSMVTKSGKTIVIDKSKEAEYLKKGWTLAESGPKGKLPESTINFFKFRVSLNEKYQLYHTTFSNAVQTAEKQAVKQGYEVDQDDWFNKIATGPKKPSEGKTNSYIIKLLKNDKPTKKTLAIQVFNMGKKYELNMYIS